MKKLILFLTMLLTTYIVGNAASITVSSPATGILTANTTWTINWTYSGVTGDVNIEYVNTITNLATLIIAVPASYKSFSWSIPVTLSGSYKVKIYTKNMTPVVVGYSGVFNIIAPSISVNTPSQPYTANTSLPINWTTSGVSGNLTVELTNTSNTTIKVIASNISNSGSTSWIIPADLTAGSYKIKVYTLRNCLKNNIKVCLASV